MTLKVPGTSYSSVFYEERKLLRGYNKRRELIYNTKGVITVDNLERETGVSSIYGEHESGVVAYLPTDYHGDHGFV